MVRDGFVWKKSRLIHGGSWERRYMRTERHMLAYFSEGLAKIQQSKIKDARAGGYRYRTEGVDPSEELDMREVVQSIDDIVRVGADLHPVDECDAEVSSPGGGARKGTKPAFGYFRVTCHKAGGSTRVIHFRTDTIDDAKAWTTTLRNIKRAEDTAGAKPIGQLSLGIRRVRVVDSPRAAVADSRVVLGVEYAGRRFRTAPKRVAGQGETFVSHDGAIASISELRDADDGAADEESHSHALCEVDAASGRRAPGATPAAGLALDVHQAQSAFRVTLERTSTNDEDDDKARHMIASRSVSLFEVQEADAERLTIHALHGHSRACPSVTWWPHVGPNGLAPAPGCVWLALFDKPEILQPKHTEAATADGSAAGGDGDGAAGSAQQQRAPHVVARRTRERLRALTPRVVAFIEVDMSYREHLLSMLLADHERKEIAEKAVPKEFDPAFIMELIDRASALADELAQVADQVTALTKWGHPGTSLVSWAYFLFLCWVIDSSRAYALPCSIVCSLVIASIYPRLTGRYQMLAVGNTRSFSDVYRPVSFLRVAVLQARNIVDADDGGVLARATGGDTSQDVSDAYARVFFDAQKPHLLPTQIGQTQVVMDDLNPIWSVPEWVEAQTEVAVADVVEQNGSSTKTLSQLIGVGVGGASTKGKAARRNDRSYESPWMVAARAHESRARCFRSAWRYPVLQQITENPITSVHSLVPWRRVDGLVRVEVWDFDTFDNDDFLGCVEIRLRDLVTAKAASNADDDASTYRNVRERAAGFRGFEGWLPLQLASGPDALATRHPHNKLLLERLREPRPDGESEADRAARKKDIERRWLIRDPEKRDAALRAYVDAIKPFGEVYVKIALELPDSCGEYQNPAEGGAAAYGAAAYQPNLMDLERQLILQELLEHRRPEKGQRDRVQGLTGQFKKFQRTMFRLQQQLHDATSLAERFVNLLSWTHPRKTALVVAGMLCGISMLLLFPNRLVVAAGVSYMYLDGLMMSLDKTEKSGQKTVAKSDIQMLNFLRSIPNKVELRNVFNLRRHFFELDQSTQHARAHIDVTHSLQVKWQGIVYTSASLEADDPSAVRAGATPRMLFAVISGPRLRLWRGEDEAHASAKPLREFIIHALPVRVGENESATPSSRSRIEMAAAAIDHAINFDMNTASTATAGLLKRFTLKVAIPGDQHNQSGQGPFDCPFGLKSEPELQSFEDAVELALRSASFPSAARAALAATRFRNVIRTVRDAPASGGEATPSATPKPHHE